MSLAGKVALVTGGALGERIAHTLAAEGATIAFTYRSKGPSASSFGGPTASKHKSYKADLGSEASLQQLFDQVKADFGHVDIAVNNVGKVLKKPIIEISEKGFALSIFEILEAYFVLTNLFTFFQSTTKCSWSTQRSPSSSSNTLPER
jgi:NAD(P)-dependent dehydrogenase (short-subunit alcohol dehydrogenase family)